MISLRGGLEPQLAHHISGIPAAGSCAGGCWFEPKWDGFRALAYVDADGAVVLESRRRKTLKDAFPDIAAAVRQVIAPRTVLDGEIVRWSESGRLDFDALQRRNVGRANARELAAAEPCHFIVFDVLVADGEQVSEAPLHQRRAVLEKLLAGVPGTSPVVLGMGTADRDLAQDWFDGLAAVGVEGLMVKPRNAPYRPGNRTAWSKVKHFTTTEAIIGGVTGTVTAPKDLLLGRYNDAGEFVVVGRTTTLRPDAARALAPHLTAAGPDHPWPEVLPVGWRSRELADYVRTELGTVVEVRVDVSATETRWRHGLRFLRVRPDLSTADVPRNLALEARE